MLWRWAQVVYFPPAMLETATGLDLVFYTAGVVRDLIAKDNNLAPETLTVSCEPADDGYHFVRVETRP